ncbi:tRNA 5-methylaminomethyl-2-thiouridine biosynthesis bifunctional protein MnmC [Thalassotalea insulae]|uniref:tRNA 5-methylaminomethyl-2-thiouridine biosynthesis bifunctional protein MnmC n=1 Tax=Thalassotalea insulae TaxID=2056778 RepID=A0ABQ6GRX4_9GAMM|nr:bifunctional tRNA (5-methylaminomethyl-2-thiouridine)(34)-methyltransferase MnmD/FAD-dependent 5-carboxymethylaminomethyl-2-thiouridine(34) oxidoreductase MnmC [Thalassotalea insulae]GLX77446.1 tRNA 5-methylaminomethyl-2-thiouridine biosynthesis bifunctional protein MnmC [Thalassotalea insulae]
MTTDNKITFQEDGSPYSEQFDDIYFDTESGFQQSEQVFINGNQIKQQLLANQGEFVIGETGFGTGLNFLLTLHLYLKLAKQHKLPKLHFISTEKYPLTRQQLAQSLRCFEQLTDEVNILLDCYPEQLNQRLDVNIVTNKVALTIYLGDATDSLSQILLPRKSPGLVNAWYLDGFSPAKNPEMWTPELFQQMARLSKPQATISTFTVAGFIRRGLQQAGFRLEKQGYQGKKKEILVGKYQQNRTSGKGYQLRTEIAKPQHVTIIGGGIASACTAYALTEKGIKVTLYCRDKAIAQGASSNAIGAIYPLLHQQVDDISRFYQQAFWHALKQYKSLAKSGYSFSHRWCGLLEVSYKKALEQRQQIFADNNPWPDELIHSVSKQQASELANIALDFGGLFMPNAGWIAPAELVTQLLQAATVNNQLKIKTSVNIHGMTQLENKKWLLHSNKGDINASVVVFCGGAESIDFPYINQLPLTSVRGQVTSLASNEKINKLSTVLCHKGYLTPSHNNIHCIGATFEKHSHNTQASIKDDQYNLNMLQRCLPSLNHWQQQDITASKARLRCMTPDHLPVVGAMPDIEQHKKRYAHLAKDKNWRINQSAPVIENLYLLTGLGARGLCTAPLLADILLADLTGTPYPVDSDMLFNLSPNRFIIRDIIKRKIAAHQ